jgi:hypothetical protein
MLQRSYYPVYALSFLRFGPALVPSTGPKMGANEGEFRETDYRSNQTVQTGGGP